jgi:PBP1b-binding outer membrane lipoprotein LpoB
MRKHFIMLVLLAICLLLAGCKKDTQINALVADVDAFTTELVTRVDSAANPAAGVDDAQKYFDSKKAEMTAKIATLKGVHGYQVSEETTRKMTASLIEDANKVAKLQIKYISLSLYDPVFKGKIEKLTRDYQALFKQ